MHFKTPGMLYARAYMLVYPWFAWVFFYATQSGMAISEKF